MAKGRIMAYRLYIDDLEGGTQYMSNEEFGAYMRLLNYQFRYGVIPEQDFINIVNRGLTVVEPRSNQKSEINDEHSASIVKLLKKKFEVKDGGFYNLRMEGTRNEALAFSERQSERRKGGNRGGTVVKPQKNQRLTDGQPIGSGSGSLGKGGVGEKPFSPADRSSIYNPSTAPDPKLSVIDPESLRRRGVILPDDDNKLNNNG